MKPRDYCCCAIPTVYVGIYLTLLEQLVLGVVAGTLSIATPSIVGAVTFSGAKWIFAIICYVGAGIQLLGFFSVFKEMPIFYRRYTTLHLLVTVAAFSVAVVWIALSAARHSTAQSNCINNFYDDSTEESEASILCNIFPWVDVGLMAGLWVLLAISQLYFYVVISSYGAGQRMDHEKYDSMYDATKPLTSDIPLNTRGDPWDARPSHDNLLRNESGGFHSRDDSLGSVDNVMGDKAQLSRNSYPMTTQPGPAYTQEPTPTPHEQDPYYYTSSYGTGLGQPERTQAHPGAL